MYTITVDHEFCAAHCLAIAGAREPVHGHNFRVTATIEGSSLDGDGLLCDFHTIHDTLAEIVAPFQNGNLNQTPPFDRLNPTAELIAKHIADALAERLDEALSPAAYVASVRVTEAAGCAAMYRRRK